MATATFKFVPSVPTEGSDMTGETARFYGTITFSAPTDTYASGGLSPLAGSALASLGPYADRTPLAVYIESQIGSGLSYYYNASTKKLQIFGGGGSGTAGILEITGGTALNAGSFVVAPSADTINFEAIFLRR